MGLVWHAVNCGGVLSITVNYSGGLLIAIPDPGGLRKEDESLLQSEASLPPASDLNLPCLQSPEPPVLLSRPGNKQTANQEVINLE